MVEIQNECKANTKQYLRQVNTALLLAVEAFILDVVAAHRWAEWTKDVRATDPVCDDISALYFIKVLSRKK